MEQRTRWLAGFSAMLLALIVTATASGYTGQIAASITIAVKGSGGCGQPIRMTAIVIDAAGKPVAGQSVDWTLVLSLSSADKISKTPTITNRKGVASTSVTLACVNGNRTVRATAGQVSAQAVVAVKVHSLPSTSTLDVGGPARSDPPIAPFLLAAIGLAVGSVMAMRPRVASRR